MNYVKETEKNPKMLKCFQSELIIKCFVMVVLMRKPAANKKLLLPLISGRDSALHSMKGTDTGSYRLRFCWSQRAEWVEIQE